MGGLVFLAIAFAPGVFWLWWIVRKNRHRPDPKHLLVRTFLLGAVLAVPLAGVIEGWVKGPFNLDDPSPSIAAAAYGAFVVAGITEEVRKFLVVRYTIY